MIVYFANRQFEILGQASTGLPSGLVVFDDLKTADVETGVSSFECSVRFDAKTRLDVEAWATAGNYILRSDGDENEFFTIIESEVDTSKQTVSIYAEDAGLDLLNEVVGEYEADKAYTLSNYIDMFAYDSGFRMGTNEAAGIEKKLVFDGDETVTARIANIAKQFGDFEVSYSFKVKGLKITNKYINVFKKRGQELGVQLRLNKDIDSVITTRSVANLATALRCTGGTPDGAEEPISLNGYKYDDGDFYVDGDVLKSRKALAKWSRYLWVDEPEQKPGHEGHIVKLFNYDTTSQATLCQEALKKLKAICDVAVNFEVEIARLPDNIHIGDRVNIVDEAGKLYLSTRLLQLKKSVANQTAEAVLGEHIIKGSGIHQKVLDLAKQFAASAKSAARALAIAKTAQEAATAAQSQAVTALDNANKAQQTAAEAATSIQTATQSAQAAQQAANEAKKAVDAVEKSVEGMEDSINSAQQAAHSADEKATTAQTKASEAEQAAAQALADAANASASAQVANEKATTATTKAEAVVAIAEQAKAEADTAKATADAAKIDAQKANADIASLGDRLTTVSHTMEADYARKTDLTEAEASLQTQISQNAAQIQSTATKVQLVDETANDAAIKAQAAFLTAGAAQAQAQQAQAEAEAAQQAADEAQASADSAQAEAATAKASADAAQALFDAAKADLAQAEADLAAVLAREDATEAEIMAAQQAVTSAQTAANKARADANDAAEIAANAQAVANTAVAEATEALAVANHAAQAARNAQLAAEAVEDSAAAQAKAAADQAAQTAQVAQNTAISATQAAAEAKAKAQEAEANAAQAVVDAEEADGIAIQAAADLVSAKQRLAATLADVESTEAEIAEAQAAVEEAQSAVNDAVANATKAAEYAAQAVMDAYEAQQAADTAKSSANKAQADADAAKNAANEAQAAVDALAVRVTTAETKITQNAEAIQLRATKNEVATTLARYTTKEEAEAALTVKANEITAVVKNDYEKTVSRGEQLITNGNGQLGTNYNWDGSSNGSPGLVFDGSVANDSPGSFTYKTLGKYIIVNSEEFIPVNTAKQYTLSFDAKTANGLAKLYGFLDFFDVDKKKIGIGHHAYVPGTLTTLAQDLKKGDTVMYLTDASTWKLEYLLIQFICWGYKNGHGYTYPVGTYSRNDGCIKYSNNTPLSDAIDYSNNTVKLHSAWPYDTIPAGTQVSQGKAGSTYKYLVSVFPPTEWQTYSGSIRGIDYSGGNITTMFPPGVAYAKVGFLWNQNAANDQLWVTNITVQDTTADTDLARRLTSAETKITQSESKIALMATKTEVSQTATNAAADAVNGIEIGGRNIVEGTANTWTDFSVGAWSISLAHTVNDTNNYIHTFDDYGCQVGKWLTFAIDLKATGKRLAIRMDYYRTDGTSKTVFGNFIEVGKTGRSVASIQRTDECSGEIRVYIGSDGAVSDTTTEQYKCLKIESGNKATDWTPAPEDMASADALAEANAGITTVAESVAALDIKAGEIAATVSRVEQSNAESLDSLSESVNALSQEVSAKMTASAVEVQIKTAMENGTSKVITSTGYTLDDEGLTIEKSGSEMKTQITDNGMTVYQDKEAVLTANNKGVDAKNLHATTYLIVGTNSRFEDYGNGRTGCFWIGGAS